ncbi:MAG TPA: hypothetical protein PKO10_03605, partial [Aliarcobacter cryaerophilus]|nr:hypothetical protein [Aliarcobacter cryaerophilus]
VSYDIKVHSSGKDKPYFSDQKYFRNADSFVNAKGFVDRILKWKSANKNYSKKFNEVKAQSRTSYEAFEYFFEEELKTAVKEKLTNKLRVCK